MRKKSLCVLMVVLFPSLIVKAQVNVLPTNSDSRVNFSFGLNVASFDFKKGAQAVRYENSNDIHVVTHSFGMGAKIGIEKKFKNTPVSISVQYSASGLTGSFLGDNEVGLVKNPIEQVFLFISPPRERNINSAKQFALSSKTNLLSASILRRDFPGIHLYLLSGIGFGKYSGNEVVFVDPPFQEITTWEETHFSLNLGGELAVFPGRKNDSLSFSLAVEKQHSIDKQRFEHPVVTFNFGFTILF